jgi:hypothetical protein
MKTLAYFNSSLIGTLPICIHKQLPHVLINFLGHSAKIRVCEKAVLVQTAEVFQYALHSPFTGITDVTTVEHNGAN